jgi:hypothetical protein
MIIFTDLPNFMAVIVPKVGTSNALRFWCKSEKFADTLKIQKS